VVNSELGKLPGLTCDALFHAKIWCGRTMYARLVRELKLTSGYQTRELT